MHLERKKLVDFGWFSLPSFLPISIRFPLILCVEKSSKTRDSLDCNNSTRFLLPFILFHSEFNHLRHLFLFVPVVQGSFVHRAKRADRIGPNVFIYLFAQHVIHVFSLSGWKSKREREETRSEMSAVNAMSTARKHKLPVSQWGFLGCYIIISFCPFWES